MVEIIAEAGKNWLTDEKMTVDEALENAKELALQAKMAGADIVKYQTHVFKDEQKKRSEARYDWIKLNESLTPLEEFWKPLQKYCYDIGIDFITTPMSKMAAEKIIDITHTWKVGSADITDFELLEYLKSTGKPIILSTGMSTREQVDKAVELLGDQIQTLMYCISVYPCPVYKIDLAKIVWMNEKYDCPIGFSDHSLSIEAPALAVRMGAVAVEKHFCLNRNNSYGPDFKVSLEPKEFSEMVRLCKLAETEGESFEEEKRYWSLFRANI